MFRVRGGFGVHFETDLRKDALREPTLRMKIPHFEIFWGAGEASRTADDFPGGARGGPGERDTSVFDRVFFGRRRGPGPGPIFGGPDPRKWCPH